MAIKRVWIEEGCTLCGMCEEECPEVFELGEESAEVMEDAEFGDNDDGIMNAVETCPVQVIHFEEE